MSLGARQLVGLLIGGYAISQPLSLRAQTFTRDVAPILYKHCVSCHHPGDIAPMSLLSYKDARPWAAAMKQAVVSGKMPPWKADPQYGSWSNDPRLSEAEITILRRWAEGGKLEGDPKFMPPAPVFEDGWKIGKPDLVISIPEQTLTATGPDQYSYLNVPTNFAEDRWIVAAELRPGNRKVVHHAHVYVVSQAKRPQDTPEAVAQFHKWMLVKEGSLQHVRSDAPVIDDGCVVDDNGTFPDTRFQHTESTGMLSSYLPGRSPDVYPAGTGRKIPAGSQLQFQIHYSRTTGKAETDVTSVGLKFAPAPPEQVSHREDFSNQMFLIPAGVSDQRVTECHTFQKNMLLTSLTPHMHLRGKSMTMTAHFPDGSQRILLRVPAYDFNWQFTYRAEKPIFLPAGTRMEIDAHFDNSANNPMNPNPNEIIRWGEASEKEMMDGWFEYLEADAQGNPKPENPKVRQQVTENRLGH